jgi:DNA-binding transcriptional regulator YiaG
MTFAEQLKSERTRLSLNQTEAAALLEVSFDAISKWERGLFLPPKIAQEGAMQRLRRAKLSK